MLKIKDLRAFQKEINYISSLVQKELARKLQRELIWGITSKRFTVDDLKNDVLFLDIQSFITEAIEHHPMCYNDSDILRLK